MGIFSKIKEGLQKTRDAMMNNMRRVLNSFTKIDEDLFEQLEETMIMSDMGVDTSVEICERLRGLVKERGVTDPQEIMGLIEEIIGDMMGDDVELNLSTTPSVIMVIGVNGAGKTTTIGKLCHQFKQQGKKVLVAAADTFRAAAIDQLEVWTQRAGVDIVKHAEGSDPGAVVFDGISAATARGCDVLIIDTAGRLHNKKNLMNELEKINRILTQKAEGCAIETLLVLDATTGQNAVSQARLFSEVANITGIVLTKLDGTAKGGIVVSIKNELGIPVKLVGVGEKIEDLQTFDNADFVRALFDHSQDVKLEGEAETEALPELPESPAVPAAEETAASQEASEPDVTEEKPEKPEKKGWWHFGSKKHEAQEAAAEELAEETATEEEAVTEEIAAAEPEMTEETEAVIEPEVAEESVSEPEPEMTAEPEAPEIPQQTEAPVFTPSQSAPTSAPVFTPSQSAPTSAPVFTPNPPKPTYGPVFMPIPPTQSSGPVFTPNQSVPASGPVFTPIQPAPSAGPVFRPTQPAASPNPAPVPSGQPMYVHTDNQPSAAPSFPAPAAPKKPAAGEIPPETPENADDSETKKGWWPFGKRK